MRGGKTKRAARRVPSEMRGAIVPVQCAEETCEAQSLLAYPGKPPYATAAFVQKGWLAMSTPLDEEVVYLCPSCAKDLINGAEKEGFRIGSKLESWASKAANPCPLSDRR